MPDASASLHVSLLDHPVVRLGDEVLDLGTGRPRALVARLALTPGVPVEAEELARDLWAEPPASAGVTLRSIVSRLRARALRDVLLGGRAGYRLEVDPDRVDVVRLRAGLRTLAEGRDRVALLEEFERGWTGRPLGGLADAPFAAREAARLHDEYAAAMEELAATRIHRGEAGDALAGLRDLVRRDPLAVRPASLLVTALARAGRDAEALRELEGLTTRLRETSGLEEPEELRGLRASVLRREFSATSGRPEPERRGVPLPITAFVGRRAELAAVQEARTRSRLVTVLGPGGVGKTRLAIEAARRDDGGDRRQVFLDLVPSRDLAGVRAALADLVGALRPDLDAIAAVLHGTPTLLVFDNAEHVVDEIVPLVSELLARCDGLTVLVTSRDPLRIPGERRVAVAPLLGDAVADAVELFAARAGDIDPSFVLDAHTTPLVRELVEAVDGLPLALELAAGRLPTRPLPQLVAEIRRRGVPGPATGGGRHASVADMVEWSTDLLAPAERELFVQLAGFAGPFSHEAAVAICAVEGAAVDDLLLELVECSLVSTSRTADQTIEYRLLLSVRQVARGLCERDRTAWRERHRRWYAALVERLRPALYASHENAATAVLERASHDLHAAVEDAIAAGDRESALLIVGGMSRVWYRRGSLVDGASRLETALGIPGSAAPIVEARAHLGHALLRFFLRDVVVCAAAIAAAIDAAEAADDASTLALAHAFHAYLAGATGDAATARASIARAAGVAGTDTGAAATVAMIAADLARVSGAPATALEGVERARRLAREAGEGWVLTLSAHIAAKVFIEARRGQEAIDLLVPIVAETWAAGRPTHAIAGLILVAAAAATVEQHRLGVRLLAAADTQARRYSWEPDATDPDGNARYRARLKSALTADEWRVERAAGQRMSVPEALALAAGLTSPGSRGRILAA